MADVTLVLGQLTHVTVDASTANLLRRVVVPQRARRVIVTSRSNAGKLVMENPSYTFADADAIGTTHYQDIPANTPMEFAKPRSPLAIGVASATTSTVFSIVAQ